jgi:hypothetical protein
MTPFYENGNRSYMTVKGIPINAKELYRIGPPLWLAESLWQYRDYDTRRIEKLA